MDNEALALIERIIEEHKTLMKDLETVDKVANDAQAMRSFEKAKEAFVPGRLNQSQGLDELEGLLKTIEQGLDGHFGREETGLMSVFEEHGDKEIASSFHSLLEEHEEMRERIKNSLGQITALADGGLSRHIWEATANDIRAHIGHTRRLLGRHAAAEQELLHKLQTILSEGS
jgi:iron-sulfur cluster repair protein YtfE (RIC family)